MGGGWTREAGVKRAVGGDRGCGGIEVAGSGGRGSGGEGAGII